MNKTGLVIKTKNNRVTLLTSKGEFLEVKGNKKMPLVGEVYSGAEVKSNIMVTKTLAMVAAILLIFVIGKGVYAYYTPEAIVTVSINPALELQVNEYNKIFKVVHKNEDGEKLIKNLDIKNMNFDEAMVSIVQEAKKQGYINHEYLAKGSEVKVSVVTKDKTKTLNFNKFQQYVSENNINTNINVNGKKNKNRDEEKNKENIENSKNESKDESVEKQENRQDIKDKQVDENNINNSKSKNNNSNNLKKENQSKKESKESKDKQ